MSRRRAGRIVRHEYRGVLDVGAVEPGRVLVAVELLLRLDLDAGDEVHAQTARALASKIDACGANDAAAAAQALPRLAQELVATIEAIRGDERPPDALDRYGAA